MAKVFGIKKYFYIPPPLADFLKRRKIPSRGHLAHTPKF
nr:MAG TPA: hypothetical protein [Caudoviricetes sp.]